MTMMDNDKPPATEETETNAAPASSGAEAKAESLEAKVARLEREKAETHDRMLRIAADFENFKRRSRREVDEAATRGREALLKELLPVLDNLDRALAAVASGGSVEALGEGVRLVDKQFHSSLEKFDVRRFEALGQPFDPARHEAIQQVETDATPPGSVAQVFARGYTVGDRLLRPAMVSVAKSPAKPSETPTDTGNGNAAPEGPLH
jgi:molecular chaperone GrpE